MRCIHKFAGVLVSTFLFAAVGSPLAAPVAAAADVLDQQQPTIANSFDPLLAWGGEPFLLAQTFHAGISGKLDRVDLGLERSLQGTAGTLVVQIRTTVGAGATLSQPSGVILSERVWPIDILPVKNPAFMSFPVDPPVVVTAGQRYAIVLTTINVPAGLGPAWFGQNGSIFAPYQDGQSWYAYSAQSTWEADFDYVQGAHLQKSFAFKTYVACGLACFLQPVP